MRDLMKFHNSYHFKIFLFLWVFGILLVAIYHLTGHSLVFFTQLSDGKGNFELEKEVDYVFDSFKNDNQASYPNSRFFTSYLNESDLPQYLRNTIVSLDTGYHFIDIEQEGGKRQAYYVAVFRQPNTPELFYILYDYTLYANEYINFQLFRMSRRVTLAFVIVGVLGILIGIYASKVLISPIKSLVAQVQDLNPENLSANFSQNFKNDEIGIFAKALETSMQRIKECIEREKNFTRDASHELRTPVTVINGAVEVIQQLPEYSNSSLAELIGRIERAAKNMEGIIDACLWLARERHVKTPKTSCLVGDIVTNAVEENRYLLSGKTISLEVIIDDNRRISVPQDVFHIAVVNLIKNAFIYTSEGQITVNVQPKYIQITNSGTVISPDKLSTIREPFQKGSNSKGFGIGLTIVESLCKRFGFKLDIDSDTKSNIMVTLSFEE